LLIFHTLFFDVDKPLSTQTFLTTTLTRLRKLFKMISFPKMRLSKPTFSSWVRYDKYDPNVDSGEHVGKSLAGLDYSPLRRVTMASFLMGILISMGGFV